MGNKIRMRVCDMEPGTYFTHAGILMVRLMQSRIAYLDGSGRIYRHWWENKSNRGMIGTVVDNPFKDIGSSKKIMTGND